jgi:DNA invertase Pin-like site-specific DNA recombinase
MTIYFLVNPHQLHKQKTAFANYCLENNLLGDQVIYKISKPHHQFTSEQLNNLFSTIHSQDIIIMQTLTSLSKYSDDVFQFINNVINHKVSLHILSKNIIIDTNTSIYNIMHLASQLDRLLDKEKSPAKKTKHIEKQRDIKLLQTYKNDIQSYLNKGCNAKSIAKIFEVELKTIKEFIKTHINYHPIASKQI